MGFKDRKYRKYDPQAEGYGNANQWREAFGQRMHQEFTQEDVAAFSTFHIKGETPASILKLNSSATEAEIKQAYRQACKEWHPDLNEHRIEEAEAMMKKINLAYQKLMKR